MLGETSLVLAAKLALLEWKNLGQQTPTKCYHPTPATLLEPPKVLHHRIERQRPLAMVELGIVAKRAAKLLALVSVSAKVPTRDFELRCPAL